MTELIIVSGLGRHFSLSSRAFWRTFASGAFFGYVFIWVIIGGITEFLLFDLPLQGISTAYAYLFFLPFVVFSISLTLLGNVLFRLTGLQIWTNTLFIASIAAPLGSLAGLLFLHLVPDGPDLSSATVIAIVVKDLFITILCIELFFEFVFPRIRQTQRDGPPDQMGEAEELSVVVKLGAQDILLDDLAFIRSIGNNLELISANGEREVVVGTLADIVARTDDVVWSISPHRSYWVNLNFVRGYRVANRKHSLLLESGQEIPVSRSRIREVRDAVLDVKPDIFKGEI